MKAWLHAVCLSILLGAAAAAAHAQDLAAMNPLHERERMLAAFDALPVAPLQDFYLRCDRESRHSLLELQEAVACAMAFDALLRRQFGGDLDALLAWWRGHRDEPR